VEDPDTERVEVKVEILEIDAVAVDKDENDDA
jgi:hypothetical protein